MTETLYPPTGLVLWTYRFRLTLPNGKAGEVVAPAGLKGIHSRLLIEGQEAASDYTPVRLTVDEAVTRNHLLEVQLDGGQMLRVQLGYVTSLKMGVRVFLDGVLIHESHPGRSLDAYEKQAAKVRQTRADNPEAVKQMADLAGQKEKFKRNWPSLAVDIALGFIFFFVAKWTDLTTAAIWGAAAGLALYVVQRFVKSVDLIGGLAFFGIVMLMLSGGYALLFQDEVMIQMRTTIIGGIAAGLYLIDGAFGGRYLGKRTARYLFMPDIVPQRLSLAFGGLSIIMALLNWGVVKLVSQDIWLYYTTFGDFVVAVILFSIAIQWVRVPGYDAASRAE